MPSWRAFRKYGTAFPGSGIIRALCPMGALILEAAQIKGGIPCCSRPSAPGSPAFNHADLLIGEIFLARFDGSVAFSSGSLDQRGHPSCLRIQCWWLQQD